MNLADVDLFVAIVFVALIVSMVIAGGVMLHFSKK